MLWYKTVRWFRQWEAGGFSKKNKNPWLKMLYWGKAKSGTVEIPASMSVHKAAARTDVIGFYVNPELFFLLGFTKDLMRALECHGDVFSYSERQFHAQEWWNLTELWFDLCFSTWDYSSRGLFGICAVVILTWTSPSVLAFKPSWGVHCSMYSFR